MDNSRHAQRSSLPSRRTHIEPQYLHLAMLLVYLEKNTNMKKHSEVSHIDGNETHYLKYSNTVFSLPRIVLDFTEYCPTGRIKSRTKYGGKSSNFEKTFGLKMLRMI